MRLIDKIMLEAKYNPSHDLPDDRTYSETAENIISIAKTIRDKSGYVPPILITEESNNLINGHHRLAAYTLLGIDPVVVWVDEDHYNEAVELGANGNYASYWLISKYLVVGLGYPNQEPIGEPITRREYNG